MLVNLGEKELLYYRHSFCFLHWAYVLKLNHLNCPLKKHHRDRCLTNMCGNNIRQVLHDDSFAPSVYTRLGAWEERVDRTLKPNCGTPNVIWTMPSWASTLHWGTRYTEYLSKMSSSQNDLGRLAKTLVENPNEECQKISCVIKWSVTDSLCAQWGNIEEFKINCMEQKAKLGTSQAPLCYTFHHLLLIFRKATNHSISSLLIWLLIC